jgi:hypothetical protein
MQAKLKCPLCGSMYHSGTMRPGDIGIEWEVGGMCCSQAMTGPNPSKCSPEHPCSGSLEWVGKVPVGASGAVSFP